MWICENNALVGSEVCSWTGSGATGPIEKGDFPQWELNIQIMSDDEHPELDFDPLDDTKLWPEDQFPWYPVGKMTLNKNPENYFAEVEQSAFGTGVLVDGLDFSDDKMLQGRTFSYSDTQRYRVATNYLQLPINAPKTHIATNQRDGQMATQSALIYRHMSGSGPIADLAFFAVSMTNRS